MDSANSGSLQSSSGGDEEYDSRPDPIAHFLQNNNNNNNMNPPASMFSSISTQQPTPGLFDPNHLINPFSHQSQNQNSQNPLYNLDLAWSRNLRSEPSFTDYTTMTPFQSSSTTTQSLLGVQGLSQGPFQSPSIETINTTKPLQTDQTNVVKNPKKRTRASRRAPTTVLTTDTTNFRQMVQEFTGIPAAPFSGTTYSRRLDLFGSGPSMRSGDNNTLGPLYPLRPSPQKVQAQVQIQPSSSFLSPNNSVNNITSTSSSIVGAGSAQSQGLLNMQIPILGFQQQSQSLLGVEHVAGFQGEGGHYGNNNNNNNINPSSDFNHGKGGLENVSSRSEGIDSWIIPSD
jgi:hypothetical protein